MVRVGTSPNENEPPFGWGGAPRARATPTYGDQHTFYIPSKSSLLSTHFTFFYYCTRQSRLLSL